MKKHLLGFAVLILILCSCGSKTEKKAQIQNGLLLSKKFNKVQNQYGNLVDFTFEIDSTEKLNIDKTDFYKLNLTAYDSIYIGKRNDTIFSYDQSIPFKWMFLILDKENEGYLGRLGTDYHVQLENTNDSIFNFTFRKIQNSSEGDHIIMGYDYPSLVISEIKVNRDGTIMDIKTEQNAK